MESHPIDPDPVTFVYTDAWVAYLIRHLSDPEEYALVCGGPASA